MVTEETAQILADADEIEFTFGSQYPADSQERMALLYCAGVLRRRFELSDLDKIDLILKVLKHSGPCTKNDLIERLDFTRDECRRLIDIGIRQGLIQVIQEPTNGRSRILLQIP